MHVKQNLFFQDKIFFFLFFYDNVLLVLVSIILYHNKKIKRYNDVQTN